MESKNFFSPKISVYYTEYRGKMGRKNDGVVRFWIWQPYHVIWQKKVEKNAKSITIQAET